MPDTFGKIKEPLIHMVGIWRAMHLRKRTPFVAVHISALSRFNQLPLLSPTVFNFFLPRFSPPGVIADNQLLAPEAQMLSLTGIIESSNNKYLFIDARPSTAPNSTATIELDSARFENLSLIHI